MAATAEGVFRIVDRASEPMRRMQRQAEQTDRAIERLGLTTDAVGSPKQTRQVNDLDRSYRNFGRTMDDTGSRARKMENDFDRVEKRSRTLKQAVTETGAAIRGMGAIIGLIKFPALAVGVGVLVQAVGALSGGVIALIPRLTDLSGVVAALPVTFVGVGLAMATVKLATNDLSKALGGNKQAIKDLTPQARQFLVTLREYQPVLKELRQSAQGGLFGGLDRALPTLMRGLPVANALLAGMSRTLGNLAAQAASKFTSNGFLSDLLGIGQAGTQVVGRGGTAILNVVDAMRQLAVAAIPFTNVLSKGLVSLSQWVDRWAIFERDSGSFGSFLGRTTKSLALFGDILHNVWDWVTALGRAARPLGDLLWRDVDKGTASWAKYANSVQGQVHLTREFLAMYPAIHEIVTLFDNLARAIFQMGTSPQLPGIVHQLNGLVPVLQSILTTLVAAFGPQLIAALVQVGTTLEILVGATGPLNIFLTLITNVFGMINSLISLIPGLGTVLATAFSVYALGRFSLGVENLAAKWWAVAAGANAAAAAEARATVAASGTAVAGVASGVALGSVAGGTLAAGERMTAGGVILPSGVAATEGAVGAGLGARLLGVGGGLLGRAGAALGRVALPVTAALGAYGGLTAPKSGGFLHQAGQFSYGALNSVSMGLAGKGMRAVGLHTDNFLTPDQLDQRDIKSGTATLDKRLAQFGGTNPTTLRDLNAQIRLYTAYTDSYGKIARPAFQQATTAMKQQLQALTAVRNNMAQMRAEQSRATADKYIRSTGSAWDTYAAKYGPAEATKRTTGDVLAEMAKLQEPGRRILAQQYLSWLQEESQRNPALVGQYRALKDQITSEYAKLGTNIGIVNGQIVTGTASSWKAIQKAMTTPAEQAKEQVNASFTAIQQKAVAILTAMGVSPSGARNMVAMKEVGGDVNAAVGAPIGSVGGRPVGSNTVSPTAVGKGDFPGTAPIPTKTGPKGGPNSGVLGTAATGLHSGVSKLAQLVTGQFPELSMTSGLRPGDTGSYHSLGEAVDLAGPPSTMQKAAAWIRSNLGGSLLEGIHNTGLSVKNGQNVPASFWGAPTWAAHANHIHLAIGDSTSLDGGARGTVATGASAGSGASKITAAMLMPKRSTLAGVPGTLADQVGALYASATASKLNAQFGASTGTGTGAAPGGSGTTSSNQSLAYSMMLKDGWSASEWPALKSLWTGESNFNALARNASSGAFGIPQALPASKMGAAAVGGDAAAQIGWGLNYIAGRYGTPTAAYQQWSAREPHWYGNGGDFVARKPMVIGVGDNPHGERVTVTPLNKLGTATKAVELHVNIGTIENHREGDIQKIVHQEFVALARELESLPVEGDEEVSR